MMRSNRQSGSIVFWLVVVTAAMAAVLVSSWMLQASPRAAHGRLSAAADEPVASANKELKLLAAKVVSSVTVPQSSTPGSSEHSTSSASTEAVSAEASLQRDNADPASPVSKPVTHSVEVRRTVKVSEPSAASVAQTSSFETPADSTGEQMTSEPVGRIDHPDDLQNEPMQTAYLQRTPEKTQTPEPVEETSIAAHANHEPSEPAHEGSGASEAVGSDNEAETNGQESKPHEIHDEVRVVSAELQFTAGSKDITDPMRPILNRVIDILSGHDDARVVVAVATNESGNKKQDVRLSQERGRAIIARLVSNGVDFSRVSLDATNGDGIPENSHIVDVQAWTLSE